MTTITADEAVPRNVLRFRRRADSLSQPALRSKLQYGQRHHRRWTRINRWMSTVLNLGSIVLTGSAATVITTGQTATGSFLGAHPATAAALSGATAILLALQRGTTWESLAAWHNEYRLAEQELELKLETGELTPVAVAHEIIGLQRAMSVQRDLLRRLDGRPADSPIAQSTGAYAGNKPGSASPGAAGGPRAGQD